MSKRLRARKLRQVVATWLLVTLLLIPCVKSSRSLLAPEPPNAQNLPQAAKGGGAPVPSGQEDSILALARQLLIEMHCFWSSFGPDPQDGGFYATLDRRGNSIPPTAKGVVQQARQLYFFSAHYMALADPRVGPLIISDRSASSPGSQACGAPSADSPPDQVSRDPSLEDQQALDKRLADQAHGFLTTRMRDPSTSLYYTQVTPDGSEVIDAGPLLNGNLMAVYALAVYARAFNYSVARDEAISTFLALESRLYDAQYGGYNELLSVPPWGPHPKTLNGLMALTQAVLELARVAPENAVVMERLRECLMLFPGKVVARPWGYARQQFNADWSPVQGAGGGEDEVSYGMQLAAAWILLEALPVAYGDRGDGGGGDGEGIIGSVRAAALQLASTAVQEGYHYGHGGFFLSGIWNSTSSKVWDKVWWVQAEALPALWQLYVSASRSSGPYGGDGGDAAAYLGYLQDTLQWIRNCQSDSQYGEWYWITYGDCTVASSYESGGYQYAGTVKGNTWKASYHNGRALMTLIQYGLEGAPGGSSGRADQNGRGK